MQRHETREAEEVARYAHMATEDQVRMRQMVEAIEGIEEGQGSEGRGNMFWDFDEELA